MNKQTKLILALQQVENITSLIAENEYKQFLYSHLISVEIELKRQILCLNNQT
jgi:hypothetical protein